MTEEIIDVILDPLGSSGGPDAPGAVEEVVVVEEVIMDPDATGTGTATDPTDPTDPTGTGTATDPTDPTGTGDGDRPD